MDKNAYSCKTSFIQKWDFRGSKFTLACLHDDMFRSCLVSLCFSGFITVRLELFSYRFISILWLLFCVRLLLFEGLGTLGSLTVVLPAGFPFHFLRIEQNSRKTRFFSSTSVLQKKQY